MTLIELLIGITLTSFIFLSASSLMLTLFASNTRSKQIDILDEAKDDLQAELTGAVRWSAKVEVLNSNTLQVTSIDGTSHTYAFNTASKTILKDGESLAIKDVSFTQFAVTDYSDQSVAASPVSLEIIIDMEHTRFPILKDHFRIVVSQRVGAATKA